jgi:hypothetical protein
MYRLHGRMSLHTHSFVQMGEELELHPRNHTFLQIWLKDEKAAEIVVGVTIS